MSNLSCGTHVAEPTANIDCRKLLNQSCRFLPKLKLPISADAKLPLTPEFLGDTTVLPRPGLTFDPQAAWEKVRDDLIVLLTK